MFRLAVASKNPVLLVLLFSNPSKLLFSSESILKLLYEEKKKEPEKRPDFSCFNPSKVFICLLKKIH